MRVARALVAAGLAVLLSGGLAGCGGGDDPEGDARGDGTDIGVLDPTIDPDEGLGPENFTLSPTEVAAGLRVVKELALNAALALGPNDMDLLPEQASELQGEIATAWAEVAQFVGENDAATRTTLETAFGPLAAAVAAKDQPAAKAAADTVAAAVDAYVAKFPGGSEPGAEETAAPDNGSMPGFDGTPAPASSAGPTGSPTGDPVAAPAESAPSGG